jgi:hypothetical protein
MQRFQGVVISEIADVTKELEKTARFTRKGDLEFIDTLSIIPLAFNVTHYNWDGATKFCRA